VSVDDCLDSRLSESRALVGVSVTLGFEGGFEVVAWFSVVVVVVDSQRVVVLGEEWEFFCCDCGERDDGVVLLSLVPLGEKRLTEGLRPGDVSGEWCGTLRGEVRRMCGTCAEDWCGELCGWWACGRCSVVGVSTIAEMSMNDWEVFDGVDEWCTCCPLLTSTRGGELGLFCSLKSVVLRESESDNASFSVDLCVVAVIRVGLPVVVVAPS